MNDDFEAACLLDELGAQPRLVTLTHGRALIVRLRDGSVHAFSELCPHQMGRLSPTSTDGLSIACPVHDYRFDMRSGACIAPREPLQLRKYEVRIAEKQVLLRLPKPKWRS